MEPVYRVGSTRGSGSARATGFERSMMLTELRLLKMEVSPLASLHGTARWMTDLSRSMRPLTQVYDSMIRPHRLVSGMFGNLRWMSDSLFPPLAAIDQSDAAAWGAAHMDLLFRWTRSGRYGVGATSGRRFHSRLGRAAVDAFARTGPAPPTFWTSAVGKAHRAALMRVLSLGWSAVRETGRRLISLGVRLVSAYGQLWTRRALWVRNEGGLLWLSRVHDRKIPSRLVRSRPFKANAPPSALARRGCPSDCARRLVA